MDSDLLDGAVGLQQPSRWTSPVPSGSSTRVLPAGFGAFTTRRAHEGGPPMNARSPWLVAFAAAAALSLVHCDDDESSTSPAALNAPSMSFFVSSSTSMTGNLGGLRGADMRCQSLAATVGFNFRTWRAYLSAEHDP